MASKVDICNFALSHVGAFRIASLEDKTKEAKECKAFYQLALDSVLEDHDWSFARKRQDLALLSDTYSGWAYAYQYPSDCANPRYISDVAMTSTGTEYNPDAENYVPSSKVKYELASNTSLTSKIILTDKANAELVYTAKVTDTNMFTTQFIDAFALKLGAYLVQPLKGKAALKQTLFGLYQLAIGNSKGVDANSDHKREQSSNTFVAARG